MVIFANIYTNFFPLIGEYEKREHYDDIDSEYATYWIKKMIESKSGASVDHFTTREREYVQNWSQHRKKLWNDRVPETYF